MAPATLARISEGSTPKGDVLATARLAGIQAAKRTDEWIPLCHSLPLDGVEVDLLPDSEHSCVVLQQRASPRPSDHERSRTGNPRPAGP